MEQRQTQELTYRMEQPDTGSDPQDGAASDTGSDIQDGATRQQSQAQEVTHRMW